MDPRKRVVMSLPLSELWDGQGPGNASKNRDLSESEIRALFRRAPLQSVVANVGDPLRWIPIEEKFSFWKFEVRPRVVDPQVEGFYPQNLPGEYAYTASEWLLDPDGSVALLEVHH